MNFPVFNRQVFCSNTILGRKCWFQICNSLIMPSMFRSVPFKSRSHCAILSAPGPESPGKMKANWWSSQAGSLATWMNKHMFCPVLLVVAILRRNCFLKRSNYQNTIRIWSINLRIKRLNALTSGTESSERGWNSALSGALHLISCLSLWVLSVPLPVLQAATSLNNLQNPDEYFPAAPSSLPMCVCSHRHRVPSPN